MSQAVINEAIAHLFRGKPGQALDVIQKHAADGATPAVLSLLRHAAQRPGQSLLYYLRTFNIWQNLGKPALKPNVANRRVVLFTDYTADGSPDQLFDFNRFIAAAKASGHYFSNLTAFVNVMKTGVVLEGIVAVDIAKSGLPSLSPGTLPFGVNIRGTLVFNFSSDYEVSDKLVNTAAMNINAANLSGLVPGNPATYTTGYPPVYSNPAKHPANVDLTSRGFANFTPYDDLPALMYNVGILDMHGPVNISGVVYSPSFMEIENKQEGQIQYFKGSLIGGGGILVENNSKATSIVSYDPNAMDILASSGTKGKSLKVVYRE